MRQRLPDSAGGALDVYDIGLTIQPGEEFDAPDLVCGCEPVPDDSGEAAADGGDAGKARKGARVKEPAE